MKNPNGYGSVFKLSGNRRKPWAVRVTKGWDDNGKQIYKYLSYHANRQEALMALADYNRNPLDLTSVSATFKDVYERFSKEHFKDISDSNKRGYTMAFKHSKSLHDMKFTDIRKSHMQDIIDNCGLAHVSKVKIKTLYGLMYKYAIENDIVIKDYARFVKVGRNTEESKKKPFTLDEIKTLWKYYGEIENVDLPLIMIHTGLRPGELLKVKTEDVFLEERYLRGGFKTKAGTNRVIPIHRKIHDLIAERFDKEQEYLIIRDDKPSMPYWYFKVNLWEKLMNDLNMDHTPHECRHTFATLMDNSGANKLSIQRIMGHAAGSITDKVYTHKDIEELIKAIDMLDY